MIVWASKTTGLMAIVGLFIISSNAVRLAIRAEQNLEGRSTYQGGWPLAAATCPDEASVACSTGGGVNPTCCPNSQYCFGSTKPYCCPTETDCESEVDNLPVCANSTWNMYGQDDNAKFFCCESGQLAVDPNSGYTGICEGSGQVVPVSLRATMVSQIGGTSIPPFASYVSGAVASGANSPATVTSAGGTGAATKSAGPTKTLLSSSATDTSVAGAAVTSAVRLSIGAIIGIAVGGCLVGLAILSLAIWCCCCRGRRRQPPTEAYEPYSSGYTPPHQQMYVAPSTSQQMYSPMPPTYQNSPYDNNAQRGLSPGTEFKAVSPNVSQTAVDERPNTFGRSEL